MADEAFTIRPATPEDDAAIAELEHASAIHHATIAPDRWRVLPTDAVAESRRFWRAVEPQDEVLVAVVDGRVIGMIDLWLRRPKDPNNARPPHLAVHLGIAIAPEARGQAETIIPVAATVSSPEAKESFRTPSSSETLWLTSSFVVESTRHAAYTFGSFLEATTMVFADSPGGIP